MKTKINKVKSICKSKGMKRVHEPYRSNTQGFWKYTFEGSNQMCEEWTRDEIVGTLDLSENSKEYTAHGQSGWDYIYKVYDQKKKVKVEFRFSNRMTSQNGQVSIYIFDK